jgi:hypothetical protein
MFNLEGLIPKLCQISQELREDDKGFRLRCAALQALASMVQYMGDHSHISMELDEVVSVIVSCYEVNQTLSIKEVVRLQDDDDLVINGSLAGLPVSGQNSAKVASDTMSASENPAHWARVCLRNMASIAKEATTVWRVLDPLFRLFDSHNYWSPENGIAFSILQEMQALMDKSGQNGHLLLSFTIKHIDHKSVAKKPAKQTSILKVASLLAKHAKLKASVTIASATSDLIKHLRKCMHCAVESPNAQNDVDKWNSALYVALEECLVQLTEKVGDVGPVLDMVGVMLENLSCTATIARTTISSVFRTVQIAASIHKSLYNQKAFPEALFHQLLLAMMHPDKKTRVGSHRVLSTIIAPSLLCPWSGISFPIPVKGNDSQSITLLALSAFSSEAVMDEVRIKSRTHEQLQNNVKPETVVGSENGYTHTEPNSRKSPGLGIPLKDENLKFMKLNSSQLVLLLSSIWSQAPLEDNSPANFEAMCHTYNIALLCSMTKSSSHAALVRCFQLAFSLRRMSLNQENGLQPSRRRCLYTMASAMLIFSAKVADIPQTIPLVKAAVPEKMVS